MLAVPACHTGPADPVPSPPLVEPFFHQMFTLSILSKHSREGHQVTLLPVPVVTLALNSLAGQQNSESPLCQ